MSALPQLHCKPTLCHRTHFIVQFKALLVMNVQSPRECMFDYAIMVLGYPQPKTPFPRWNATWGSKCPLHAKQAQAVLSAYDLVLA